MADGRKADFAPTTGEVRSIHEISGLHLEIISCVAPGYIRMTIPGVGK
jgi:hypothetical protein